MIETVLFCGASAFGLCVIIATPIIVVRLERRRALLVEQLVKRGFSERQAELTLKALHKANRGRNRLRGVWMFLGGAACALLAVLFSARSWHDAKERGGGVYVVGTGAFALGAVLVLVGLIQVIAGIDLSFVFSPDNPPVPAEPKPVRNDLRDKMRGQVTTIARAAKASPRRDHELCYLCGKPLEPGELASRVCRACRA